MLNLVVSLLTKIISFKRLKANSLISILASCMLDRDELKLNYSYRILRLMKSNFGQAKHGARQKDVHVFPLCIYCVTSCKQKRINADFLPILFLIRLKTMSRKLTLFDYFSPLDDHMTLTCQCV